MPTVTIHATKVDLAEGAPLIELDEIDPTLIPFGCRAGACGSCVLKVTEGAEKLTGRGQGETNALEVFGYPGVEYRLACKAKILGNVSVEPVNA